MRINNCNCGQKLDCHCIPYFDEFQNNTVSVLSIGNLVSSNCIFDEYVIDWFLNDVHTLVTGKGYDPDIKTFHPFVGSSAIPVIGGQWKPVLRYVVVNGIKLNPIAKKCQNWCPDLNVTLPSIDIPFINVTNLSCGLVGGSPAANYDYKIFYTTNQDFSAAQRTFRYYLDGTASYIAILFEGQLVADRIEVFFGDNQPLADYVVGSRNNATVNFSTPTKIGSTVHRFVRQIPEHQAGDYLTFKITPSFTESPVNTETNWSVNLKCLYSGFNCSFFDASINLPIREYDLSNLTFTYDTDTCRFNLKVPFAGAAPQTAVNNPLRLYSLLAVGSYQNSRHDLTENWGGLSLAYNVSAQTVGQVTLGRFTTTDCSGSITVSKSGNIFTFVFSDTIDYNAFLDSYNSLNSTDLWYRFVADPTNIRYYAYFSLNLRWATVQCGDNESSNTYYFHVESTFVFSGNTLTITAKSITNQSTYPNVPCNNVPTSVSSRVFLINGTLNIEDFSNRITRCRVATPFATITFFTGATTLPGISSHGGVSTNFAHHLQIPCNWSGLSYSPDWSGYHYWWFYFILVITASRGSDGLWIDDPLENFQVYWCINKTTGVCNRAVGERVLIYEKINGNIETSIPYNEL